MDGLQTSQPRTKDSLDMLAQMAGLEIEEAVTMGGGAAPVILIRRIR